MVKLGTTSFYFFYFSFFYIYILFLVLISSGFDSTYRYALELINIISVLLVTINTFVKKTLVG
jgi:hypothetical protein